MRTGLATGWLPGRSTTCRCPEDLDINVTREKKLTNVRSSTADVIETLAKPIELDLEQAMEFCATDECVEVTPEVVRVRKVELDHVLRPKSGPGQGAGVEGTLARDYTIAARGGRACRTSAWPGQCQSASSATLAVG